MVRPIRTIAAALALAIACQVAIAADAPAANTGRDETAAERDARMAWWREARFGMFIHWGIYSVPAGVWQGKEAPGNNGEWIMLRAKIPVADYAAFANDFNPVKFDAEEWVALAKAAGMKYIVITSKHHDGFAIYPSDHSDFDIADRTPFKRDPLAELVDAAHRAGLKIGFYYSQSQDWHHPGGGAWTSDRKKWDPAQEGSMDEYIDKVALPQAREILTKYPIDIIWWDTPGPEMTPERAAKFLPLLELRPGIITNNRLGGGIQGDTDTPEQFVPATGIPGRDWEVCMTMNDTWGFKSGDHNWKSPERLVRQLVDSASKGGNYLLNVGPTKEGVIPEPSVERLHAVGEWMKVNSESIYATTASPFRRLVWGRCTQKPGKLYLHVFDWPAGGRLEVPMSNPIAKAYLLADPARTLAAEPGPRGQVVTLPAAAPDPIDTVVVVEIEGDPQPLDLPVAQASDGTLALEDPDVVISGPPVQILGLGVANNVFWMAAENSALWKAQVDQPGKFAVTAEYGADASMAGNEFTLTIGEQVLQGKVEETGGRDKMAVRPLGEVTIAQVGIVEFKLTTKPRTSRGLMNLRAIRLEPVGPTR